MDDLVIQKIASYHQKFLMIRCLIQGSDCNTLVDTGMTTKFFSNQSEMEAEWDHQISLGRLFMNDNFSLENYQTSFANGDSGPLTWDQWKLLDDHSIEDYFIIDEDECNFKRAYRIFFVIDHQKRNLRYGHADSYDSREYQIRMIEIP